MMIPRKVSRFLNSIAIPLLIIQPFLCSACWPEAVKNAVIGNPAQAATPAPTKEASGQIMHPLNSPGKSGLQPTPAPPQMPTLTPSSQPDLNAQEPVTPALFAFNSKTIPTPSHAPIHYIARSGDTLQAVTAHFGIQPDEILSPSPLPENGFLPAGQLLILPPRQARALKNEIIVEVGDLMPDSEIVYGPSAVGFDVAEYLTSAGGYLGRHREYLGSTAWTSASDVITRIALENSINPRLLVALLEHECGCVLGDSQGRLNDGYVLNVDDYQHRWLYRQLGWAANELSIGYYGWRSGTLTEISLPNGIIIRPSPDSNAGSVALLHYFSALAIQKAIQHIPVGQRSLLGPIQVDDSWSDAIDPQEGFPKLYERMFGNAWQRADAAGPVIPMGLAQPELELPFEPGYVWSYTSGPHKAWQTEGALAALDFAPSSKQTGCVPSKAWVTAVADGPIVRQGDGYVIQDLDSTREDGVKLPSDGQEETGWAILYMHIESRDKLPAGLNLKQGDPIGHPSCEGGPATGTHLHIARKYNGEWIAADGPIPFNLSGWIAHAGRAPYEGTLTKGEHTVIAHPYGSYETLIWIGKESTPITGPTKTPKPEKDDKF